MPFISATFYSIGLRSYGRFSQHIPTLPFSAFGKCPNKIILWFPAKHAGFFFFSWGTAAMCSGAVNSFPQILATRSLLGIFESVFGSGAPYFLSLFYQRQELGLRVSILLGMSPVANCFASALAYGITHIRGSIEPWRYLFIIGEILTYRLLPTVLGIN